MSKRTTLGVEALCADPRLIPAGNYGLVTNFTGVMADMTRNVEALRHAGVRISALFGPEHGLQGSVQAGETESSAVDELSGLPLYETYMKTPDELDQLVIDVGVDGLLFDMQDIGVRFYTYVWTMYDCLLSAARTGVRLVVLDRPNPLTGVAVAGPGVKKDCESFVGRIDVPLRHGLTVGELARYANGHVLPDRLSTAADLQVVPMAGWYRSDDVEWAGTPWVAPSPNMPTPDTAHAFCGTGLFEGTNVSEGRGTTRPFETIGAPYVNGSLIQELRALELPGVLFRETWFVPTFHKHAGETCRGVQLHVTDRREFDPVRTGVLMLSSFARLHPEHFSFLVPGERVDAPERGYAIDRLWGSNQLRRTVEGGEEVEPLLTPVTSAHASYPEGVLLYADHS